MSVNITLDNGDSVKLPTYQEFYDYGLLVRHHLMAEDVDPADFNIEVLLYGTFTLSPAVRVQSLHGAFEDTIYSAVQLGSDGLTPEKAEAQATAVTRLLSYIRKVSA